MKKAFTLIEILIVVSILGILAAIVFPEFQAHAQQSREAAAKDNLRILRNTIGVYAAQNNDVPPGYINNDTSSASDYVIFQWQLVYEKQYLSELPKNPFNNKSRIYTVEGVDIPATPVLTDLFGWIYIPELKEIRLNTDGVDSVGMPYYEY